MFAMAKLTYFNHLRDQRENRGEEEKHFIYTDARTKLVTAYKGAN